MSSGWTSAANSAAFGASVRSYTERSRSPSGPPSPSNPCSRLWMRLVISKNSGPPEITAHRASTPTPRL